MSKYRRAGRWTIRVPDPDTGRFVPKGTGTTSRELAGHYETMCALLLDRHADHVFLRAVIGGRIRLRRLYAFWATGTLGELRDERYRRAVLQAATNDDTNEGSHGL